jgi:predicted nuclease of restriction endonuclease-like (RecB) superfamily
LYGEKEVLMVKYLYKEHGDHQKGNTNRRKSVKKSEAGFLVTEEYRVWINDVKKRIKQSQIKASVKVNYELLSLYWDLGRDIVEKQENAKWGDSFLAVMSKDLKREFPDMAGFSAQNLKHIRYWYRFYSHGEKGLQLVTQFEIVERMIKSIPWGHNQRIAYKCKDINEAIFYVQKTLDNNWSRNVLEHQIDGRLYERQGKAITNFQVKLPEPQSDLAAQTLKDPYNFDFLTMREEYDEKELEDALVNQITQFLLELGTGFSYLGRQVHIKVGDSDFYMDLLFYQVRLHCYVVVELKAEKFKPEFAGKLNFYVTAVNKNMKTEQDNQTIGILICKDKDDVVAEYALDDMSQPIGIAQYELTKVLRDEFKSSLPTIEEIENELSE